MTWHVSCFMFELGLLHAGLCSLCLMLGQVVCYFAGHVPAETCLCTAAFHFTASAAEQKSRQQCQWHIPDINQCLCSASSHEAAASLTILVALPW